MRKPISVTSESCTVKQKPLPKELAELMFQLNKDYNPYRFIGRNDDSIRHYLTQMFLDISRSILPYTVAVSVVCGLENNSSVEIANNDIHVDVYVQLGWETVRLYYTKTVFGWVWI